MGKISSLKNKNFVLYRKKNLIIFKIFYIELLVLMNIL